MQSKLGMVPNLLRTLGNAPAALDSYLQLSGALAKEALSGRERELLALRIGQANQCDYCLAAHTAIAGSVGVDKESIRDARQGASSSSREQALLRFVDAVLESKGFVSDAQLQAAADAGLDHVAVLEVIAHVALNTLTNYTNHVAQTKVDFPAAEEISLV